MKAPPAKLVSVSALLALLLLVFLFVLASLQKFQGLPPSNATGTEVLEMVTPSQTSYWVLLQALYGSFFLLMAPVFWAVYQRVKVDRPLEGTLGFLAGALALASESLGRWWHVIVEFNLLRAYQGTADADARSALLVVIGNIDWLHRLLHYGSFLIVGWALLLLLALFQQRSMSLWIGWLAFAMVPALGPFPFVAILFLIPAMLVLWRGQGAADHPKTISSRRSSGGRSAAKARR